MSNPMHDLLDSAADGRVPDGLAHAAVAGARRRRRNRLVSAVSVVAVLLLAVPVGMVLRPMNQGRVDGLVAGVDGLTLPKVLPSTFGLPTLAEAPMDAAVAAYIEGREIVLINAADGSAVTVFAQYGATASSGSADNFSPTLEGYTAWESVSLSPDGTKLLMWAPPGMYYKGVTSSLLYLLDIPTGQAQQIQNLSLRQSVTMVGNPFPPQLVAWSPNGSSFACACSTDLSGDHRAGIGVVDVGSLGPDGSLGNWSHETGVRIQQVAWGDGGIAYQAPNGRWSSYRVASGTSTPLPGPPAPLLTLSSGLPTPRLLEVGRSAATASVATTSGRAGTSPAKLGCWVLTLQKFIAVNPVVPQEPFDRGGCQPLALGAARGGFVMTLGTFPRGMLAQADQLGVFHVSLDGSLTKLTELPNDALSPTFAATII